jgi:thiamine pyrophosphokinase
MRTLIVTGGEAEGLIGPIEEFDLVIAADSGFDHAGALELRVDLVVGDFDSVKGDLGSVATEVHPRDKDHSDLELALDVALARGTSELLILGGGGGRLDHLLVNAAVIAHSRFRSMQIRWESGVSTVHVVWDRTTIRGRPGDIVTLLAAGGDASGVTTSGLRWALRSARLAAASSRGLSNEMLDNHAWVSVATGVLLAIHTPL